MLSPHVQAAVDCDIFAGDKTGCLTGQKQNRLSDIFRNAVPAERSLPGHFFSVPGGAESMMKTRLDETGKDAVDPNAVFGKF